MISVASRCKNVSCKLESSLLELRARRGGAASAELASSAVGAGEPSGAAFALPAVALLSVCVASLGFAAGAYTGATVTLRRQYSAITGHSPI